MGKHSATDGQDDRDNRIPDTGGPAGDRPLPSGPVPSGPRTPGAPGTGRRRRGPAEESDYFVPLRANGPDDPPGHPEHREHAAWGGPGDWPGPAAPTGRRDLPLDPVEEWAADWAPYDTASALGSPAAHAMTPRHGPAGAVLPRPRQEFLDAFDEPPPPRPPVPRPLPEPEAPEPPAPTGSSRGRTRALSGIAAVAVVAAVAVLAGQLHRDHGHHPAGDDSTPGDGHGTSAGETPSPPPASPSAAPGAVATPASYDTLMARQYPLDPKLRLSGAFTTVPGHQAAPGKGKVLRFRVDVERGLPLDARLFSDTVFTTLNDPRSWGHGGTKTFERVSSGPADIVVTLASPGTTAKWCAKAGLDTSVENVSCDAASTPRTMINAYRWAQGAATYGPARMHAYRQMLINHEVGHRLGHGHVGCPRAGAPAPVMMQQTKFLSLDGGPTCTPNPWPFP